MNQLYETTIERNGKDVEIECEYTLGNDGIGAYEYHGFREYDRGNMMVDTLIAFRIDDGKQIILTQKEEETIIDNILEDQL